MAARPIQAAIALAASALLIAVAISVAGADEHTELEVTTADDIPGAVNCPDAENCSLRAAIEEANDDAGPYVIVLPEGTYELIHSDGTIEISDDVTIKAADGLQADDVVIDALKGDGNVGRHFEVADNTEVAFERVTVTGGRTDGRGGAVEGGLSDDVRITVAASTFTDNEAFIGGAIRAQDVTVEDSIISDNTAEAAGALEVGDITIRASELSSNTATSSGGGAIRGWGAWPPADVIIEDSTLSGNEADGDGGAIRIRDSNVTIKGETTFSDNKGGWGGAIRGGPVTNLTVGEGGEATFTGNTAQGAGGAILAGSDGVMVEDGGKATFSGNRAKGENGDGGAIRAWAGNVTIEGEATFTGNEADGDGGAIYTRDGNVRVDGKATFGGDHEDDGNTAGGVGGAIRTEEGDIHVTGSTLKNNTADIGGAIRTGGPDIDDSSDVEVVNSIVSNNRATDRGGAIHAWSPATVTIKDSEFSENHAEDGAGGAILGAEQGVTVEDSLISKNKAEGGGGAIASEDITIKASTLSHNTAGASGGAINSWNHLTVDGSTLSDNHAEGDGGAIRVAPWGDPDNTIKNSTLSGNTTGGDGGAVLYDDGWMANTLELHSVTLAANNADGAGQAMFIETREGGGKLLLRNTIVAADDGSDACAVVEGSTIVADGHNLGTDATCELAPDSTDLVEADPGLEDLAANGDATATHGLNDDSPAVGAADPEACLDTDQRGVERPQGDGCDIGAYELEFTPPAPQPDPAPDPNPEEGSAEVEFPDVPDEPEGPADPDAPEETVSVDVEVGDDTVTIEFTGASRSDEGESASVSVERVDPESLDEEAQEHRERGVAGVGQRYAVSVDNIDFSLAEFCIPVDGDAFAAMERAEDRLRMLHESEADDGERVERDVTSTVVLDEREDGDSRVCGFTDGFSTFEAVVYLSDRFGGDDRYATAARAALEVDGEIDTVVVVSGAVHADGLAAGALVAQDEAAVLLLTDPHVAPQATLDALEVLSPDEVVVGGGVAAVSEAVAEELAGHVGAQLSRLGGADRFATAATIAISFGPADPATVFVATGQDYPDALTAGAAAAADGAPVLLTLDDRLPAATEEALVELAPDEIVLVGGESAVSDAVESALAAHATVSRAGGVDRYATAAALAGRFDAGGTVVVATGQGFADAIVAAAHTGGDAPVVLAEPDRLPQASADTLEELEPFVLTLIGGAAALDEQVELALTRALPRREPEDL